MAETLLETTSEEVVETLDVVEETSAYDVMLLQSSAY
jgi:hypothetical protein